MTLTLFQWRHIKNTTSTDAEHTTFMSTQSNSIWTYLLQACNTISWFSSKHKELLLPPRSIKSRALKIVKMSPPAPWCGKLGHILTDMTVCYIYELFGRRFALILEFSKTLLPCFPSRIFTVMLLTYRVQSFHASTTRYTAVFGSLNKITFWRTVAVQTLW